jgi:hypothetical protein
MCDEDAPIEEYRTLGFRPSSISSEARRPIRGARIVFRRAILTPLAG